LREHEGEEVAANGHGSADRACSGAANALVGRVFGRTRGRKTLEVEDLLHFRSDLEQPVTDHSLVIGDHAAKDVARENAWDGGSLFGSVH